MDRLESKTVKIESIPAESYVPQRSCGRMGEAWNKLLALRPGECEEIANRDFPHATYTLRHLRARAAKERRTLQYRRAGTALFCWLEQDGEVSG